jgi:hypothetical protein
MTISIHDPRRIPWLAKKLGMGQDEPGDLDLSKDTRHGDVQLNPFQANFNANPFSGNKGQSGASPVNYGDYQYGNNPGDAKANALASQYGSQSAQQYGASLAGQGQLGNFYVGQLNGTGPNLSAQYTDQSLAAQQAAAASAKGSLGQAGAQEQAGMAATQARQAGAQAAVQEKYNAAQGLAGLSATQQQASQGWAGQQQNVWTGEQNAKNAQGNYELGQGAQAQQGSEYGGSQLTSLAGAAFGAAGAAAGADADLIEPGGGAGETLREERATKGHPGWVLMVDHQTGEMSKVATTPLTPEEHAQARGEHGAGPLNSPQRDHTDYHDLGMGTPSTGLAAPRFGDAPGSLAGTLGGNVPGTQVPAIGPSMTGLGAPPSPLAWGGYNVGNVPGTQVPAIGPSTTGLGAPPSTAWAPAPAPLASGGYNVKPWTNGGHLSIDTPEDAARWGLPQTDASGGPSAAFAAKPKPPEARSTVSLPAAGGVGGGGPVKTGFVDTMDPKDRAKLESGFQAENSGRAKLGEDLADEEKQLGANSASEGEQIGRNQDDLAVFERQRQHHEKNLEYQVDQASRDAEKLGKDYGWHPTRATRVRYGIANFLGALGAGLAHTQNFAAQQIQDNINRDLDAQQKQIESAKGRVGDMKGMLADAYRQTGDMRQAKIIANIASLDKVRAEGSAFAHASKSKTVLDNQKVLDATVEQKQAELRAQYMKMVQTGGGGGGVDPHLRDKVIATGIDFFKTGKYNTIQEAQAAALEAHGLAPPGTSGAAAAKDGAKPNVPSAALAQAEAELPKGAGLDAYNRNAPDFLQSSEKIRERQQLADLVREYQKAGGQRPSKDDAEALAQIGRLDPESVAAFRKRARARAAVTANAGQAPADNGEP